MPILFAHVRAHLRKKMKTQRSAKGKCFYTKFNKVRQL